MQQVRRTWIFRKPLARSCMLPAGCPRPEYAEGLERHSRSAIEEMLHGLPSLISCGHLCSWGFRLVSPNSASERGSQICLAHPEGYAIIQVRHKP